MSSSAVKYKNKIKCKTCGDIIESRFTHDFQQCKCGNVYVDGGLSYQRIGCPVGNPEDWFEYIWEEIDVQTI